MHIRLLFAALLCSLGAAAATPDPNSAVAGCWRFDDCDGKTVKDRSPRGNDGTIVAGQLCKEKGVTSLELDGWEGHVLINEKTPFNFSNSMSASIWVKLSELKRNMVLFGMPHTNDTWTTPMFGMYIDGGRAVFGLTGNRSSPKVLLETAAELPVKTWTCLTATYDGAIVKLYTNGIFSAELPRKGPIVHNGQPLIIGKGLGDAKPLLQGRVGELRLYERALSTEEVRALYDKTAPGYDLSAPRAPKQIDGTVIVKSPGSNPDSQKPWREYPTRLMELVKDYTPSGDSVKLDAFGGRADRPKLKATGFFRVEKIADRFWLIDPEGNRFFHVAINAVREPKNAAAKFGSKEEWAAATTALFRENGFNGTGNWSSPNLNKVKQPLVWVLRTNFMFEFAKKKGLTVPASGTVGFINNCMPVFHPDFEPFCEEFAKQLDGTANDPTLLGIMTDNEIQCPVNMIDRYLALDTTNPDLKPGHDAALQWLKARKGSDDPKKLTKRDRYEFITFAFERYYRIVTKNIRKHDRNHLYLGSRINYHQGEFDNPWFWKMLTQYHDVVSVNYYAFWGPQKPQFASWAEWSNKPVLLTEWYAKAMDVPGLANTHGAGWAVKTQEDRARYYQHFALNALEIKNIVGWHFFKYSDDPKESKALDSAGGANKGMFNVEGEPYKPLLDRARAVNREAYPLIEFFDARNR